MYSFIFNYWQYLIIAKSKGKYKGLYNSFLHNKNIYGS